MQKLLLILPFLILFSCSVQKRKYQKGFYVSNTNKHITQAQKNDCVKKDPLAKPLILKQTTLPVTEKEEMIFSTSAVTKPDLLLLQPLVKKLINPDSLCDLITLKNGDEVKAKVLEITPTEIKYQKCGVTDGPLYVVKKTDVFMIKYVNGTKEVFKSESEPANNNNQNPNNYKDNYHGPQKTHPLAIWAFVLGLLGFFTYGIGSVLAVLLGNKAQKRIRENPKMYKGELLAKVGKILGIVMLSILAFILFIVILAALLGL
ncbi:MAG: DUF4190 domain-containing protein [Bacteroidetes bacterium]|nr:DUF4190 domain-containing protein [Bacteroidota bacterium]